MRQKIFSCLRQYGLKAVVILLLAALIITYQPSGAASAAPPMAAAVNNTHEAGVKGASDAQNGSVLKGEAQLPEGGGISPSTLLGLVGLAFITTGGTVFTILKKKSHDKNN